MLAALLLLAPTGFAPADPPAPVAPAPAANDQDSVLRAVQEGRLKPLAEVMQEVLRSFPGRIVEMELEEDDGRMVYEFDIMTPDGRLIEVDADATTGTILGMEEDDD